MELLVAYDVGTITQKDARRLQRVASVCERYGTRVQYSLFECRVASAAFEAFKFELSEILDPTRDRVDIFRFDRPLIEVRTSLGLVQPERPGGSWII